MFIVQLSNIVFGAMMFNNTLSKSTLIMFFFDLITLVLSTVYWYNHFNLPFEHMDIAVLLTTLTGIIVLFLKDNYKIREFNSTLKNSYLLFEGVVFSQIPATILLLTFNQDVKSFEFILFNLLTIYAALFIYRRCFHYYLFNIKKIKNVLIIGSNSNAKLIADEIINKKALRMNVSGFVEYDEEDKIINDTNIAVLPKVYELDEIIKDKKVDIVIVAIKHRMEEEFLTKMVNSIPKDVKVYKMPEFYEMVTGKYFVDRMSINWLFYDYMKNRSFLQTCIRYNRSVDNTYCDISNTFVYWYSCKINRWRKCNLYPKQSWKRWKSIQSI